MFVNVKINIDYGKVVTDRKKFGTAGCSFSNIFRIYLLLYWNSKLCNDKVGSAGGIMYLVRLFRSFAACIRIRVLP